MILCQCDFQHTFILSHFSFLQPLIWVCVLPSGGRLLALLFGFHRLTNLCPIQLLGTANRLMHTVNSVFKHSIKHISISNEGIAVHNGGIVTSGHVRRACGFERMASAVSQWHVLVSAAALLRQTALIFRVLDSSLLDYTQWNLRGIEFSKTPRMPFIHCSPHTVYATPSLGNLKQILLWGGWLAPNPQTVPVSEWKDIHHFLFSCPLLFRFFALWSLSKCWREIQMNQVAAILVGGTENTESPGLGSGTLVPPRPVSAAEPGRQALRLISESKADQAARADLVYKGSPLGLALATGRQTTGWSRKQPIRRKFDIHPERQTHGGGGDRGAEKGAQKWWDSQTSMVARWHHDGVSN